MLPLPSVTIKFREYSFNSPAGLDNALQELQPKCGSPLLLVHLLELRNKLSVYPDLLHLTWPQALALTMLFEEAIKKLPMNYDIYYGYWRDLLELMEAAETEWRYKYNAPSLKWNKA